jgi:hypothetical protein
VGDGFLLNNRDTFSDNLFLSPCTAASIEPCTQFYKAAHHHAALLLCFWRMFLRYGTIMSGISFQRDQLEVLDWRLAFASCPGVASILLSYYSYQHYYHHHYYHQHYYHHHYHTIFSLLSSPLFNCMFLITHNLKWRLALLTLLFDLHLILNE